MKKIHSLCFALLIFSLPQMAWAEPEIKGSPSEIRSFLTPVGNSIFLSADAMEIIKPNQANITLKIKTEDAKLSVAMEKNQIIRDDIIQRLNQAGISSRNVVISKFANADNSAADQSASWVNSPATYFVMNRITIIILNESQMQAIARIVDDLAAVSILEIEYKNITQDEFENEVRAKAIEKALQQKAFLKKNWVSV